MDSTALAARLQERLPGLRVEPAATVDRQSVLYVHRDDLVAALRALREEPEWSFDVLADVTAVDFWPREPRFEVVYMLVSLGSRLRVRVKVQLPGDDAHVPTATALWPAANWLEREVWDLFGIEFDGHPDPRRLLMPEDWEGFPLRKDYPVQIVMKPRITSPTQVTEEEFRANIARDRLGRG